MAIIVVGILLAIADHFFVSDSLVKKLLKYASPKIKESYAQKIKKKLSNVELPFQNEIINESIEQTKYLIKVKKLIAEQ